MSRCLRPFLAAFVFLVTLPAAAQEEVDAKQLCDSMNAEPVSCYVRWVPNMLSIVSLGVELQAKKGGNNEHGAASARKTTEAVYRYARPLLKDDAQKLERLERAHKYALQSFKMILPREGVAEEDRVKDVAKRRASLEKQLAPLLDPPKN